MRKATKADTSPSDANHRDDDDDDDIKLWELRTLNDVSSSPAQSTKALHIGVGGRRKLISGKVLNHHSYSHHAIHEIIRFSLRPPVPPHLNRNLDGIQIDYFNSFKLIIKALITQFELIAPLCVLSMGFATERNDDDYDCAPCFVFCFKLSHLSLPPPPPSTKRLVPSSLAGFSWLKRNEKFKLEIPWRTAAQWWSSQETAFERRKVATGWDYRKEIKNLFQHSLPQMLHRTTCCMNKSHIPLSLSLLPVQLSRSLKSWHRKAKKAPTDDLNMKTFI